MSSAVGGGNGMSWYAFLLASLVAAPTDTSFEDLGFVDLEPSECNAQFDRGRIDVVQAFNETDRTITTAAVITGKPSTPLPLGSRLWIKSGYGPAWHALVVESSSKRFRVATNARFVGDLFADDAMTIALYPRLDGVTIREAALVDVVYDQTNVRQKLSTMMDCGDGLGI